MQFRPISEYIHQFAMTILYLPRAVKFIRLYELWKGFWKYGWVSRIMVVVAILAGLKFFSVFIDWIGGPDEGAAASGIYSMGLLMKNFALGSFDFVFSSSTKYIMLILLEVLVFHFSRRTMEILTKKAADVTFDDFLKAQIRMIKVVIRSWVMELIATILLGIVFGIFGFLDFLEAPLIFGVQCYYLGFTIVDNYHEQFHLTIKESAQYARGYLGVVLATGLFMYVLMLVPLIGAVAAPCIGAVAVSLIMFRLADLHLREEKAVEDLAL